MLRRAWSWTREQLPFLAVVAAAAAGFAYLLLQPGRTGQGRSTGLIAGALLSAGVLRLVLPTLRAGMLVVRGRFFDTLCYLAMGGLLLGLDIRLHA